MRHFSTLFRRFVAVLRKTSRHGTGSPVIARDLLETLMERAPVGILLLDHHGRPIRMSRTAHEILERVGGIESVLHAAGVDEATRELLPSYEAVRTATLADRYYELRFVPLSIGEMEKGILLIMLDLTERRSAEERRVELTREHEARRQGEELHRQKDEFLSMLSHELRTPMTTTLGWTQLLRSGELDESTQHQALESIEESVRAQARLANEMMESALVLFGKPDVRLQPTDFAAEVLRAIDGAQKVASLRNLDLDVDVPPAGACVIAADPPRVRQITSNLLSNAMKYTPSGGKIAIRLTCLENDAELVISDTGCGVTPDFLPFVFEPFRQADIRRSSGGFGVGLAVVHRLVSLQKGTVAVASDGPWQGTRVTVKLPLLVGASARTTRRPSESDRPRERA